MYVQEHNIEQQNHVNIAWFHSFTFTGKGLRKGWRTPLSKVKYSEQRDEEKERSRGPFASERGDEPRSGIPYCSVYSYTYFGARYMDHELMTMWLSVDPLADKYPGISPYAYCAWNPVKLVDPDGREVYITIDNERYYLNIVNNKAIWKTKEGKPIVFDKGQTFFYKLTKSLNLLLSKDFGRNLVEELANDKVHELEIVKSSRDGACYETSTLGWTGFSSRGDYETTDYSNGGSPEFIRLAHELGHFYCKWYNTIENPEGVWFTYKNESGEEKPIRNCE